MSATGMAPPTLAADTQTVKDNTPADSHPPAEDNTPEKTTVPLEGGTNTDVTPTATTTPVEGRTTRTRAESRGRRLLTCKTCKFTCNNSQEFTQHQTTAHAEEAETEESQPGGRTRFSSRLKRAASSSADPDAARNSAKKIESPPAATTTTATPKGGLKTVLRRQSTPSVIPKEGSGLKLKLHLPTPIALKEPAVSKASDEDCADTDRPGSPQESVNPAATRRSPEEAKSPELAEVPQDSSCTEPGQTSEPAGATTMISTNGPGLGHNDLSVSGTSEDEDMSEEGGRLVIDDSSGGGGSGSAAIPTRCGNIQNRTYICDDCDFTTTSAKHSLLHKKDEHGYDFTIYSCDLCDYATKYKQKLPRHYKLHFSGSDTPLEGQISESALSALVDPSLLPPSIAPTLATSALTPTPASASSASAPTPTLPGRGPKRSADEAGLSPPTPHLLPAEVFVEDGEEEDEEEELVESDPPTPQPEEAEGPTASAALEPPQKKKRKDVSPDKYFEVAEEVATTKFGCAKCGNVYKWKKSLNKHWKEKHGGDPGDSLSTPPGMHILLQQNNHVQTEHRRCCHKTFLEQITVKHHNGGSRSPTPQNFLNGHYNGGQLSSSQEDDVDGEEPVSYIPTSIRGPFVLGTSTQPVFPPSGQHQSLINNLHAPIPSSSSSVLDLTTHTLDETDSAGEAFKPLDFSVGKSKTPPPPPSSLTPRPSTSGSNPATTAEEDKEVTALNELQASSRDGQGIKSILKCPKCGEVLKTQTAYSNHMAMHLQSANKRVAKCGVCQTHFPNNEALNQHFMDRHMDLITSHKEAIQKIPHGLQQTYHLLKMPLQHISKLTTSDTDDPLKCNMCEFTAKWPAELQKHAVSHSDERPFVCMVCGSTYKWKWDLVKHFEKAHSSLPNPYKRREAGAASTATSGALDPQVGLGADLDMEEGEISLHKVKEHAAAGSGVVESPRSFLFEQNSPQDDSSVENLLRTSHQASLMMSRQPNFLDSPENTLGSASGSPHRADSERLTFDMSALAGMALPTTSSGLPFNGDLPRPEDGVDNRNSNGGAVRNARAAGKSSDQSFASMGARPKAGHRGRAPYRGYRTVEGSESSDLKYQCLQCEYKARWPSEIMQHMKNHSTEKPYGCPNCTYRSKWKWDVVKHLKRCGTGGTIKDVIDYNQKSLQRDAPPNVMVTPEGGMVQAQQGASPVPGTGTGEESAPAGPSIITSEAQVLPATFLPSMVAATTSSSAVPITAMTPQDYVSLIYQRTKAVSEAISSAVGGSAHNGPEPSASSQPEAHGPQQAVTYNSIINDGQHHCLHCTFVAGSVAELRRHQVLHSDEKPYTCDECSYSTKWKCDMKKHKEKYKHFGPIRVIRPSSDGKDDDKQTGHKCSHCPFQAHTEEGLQAHVKSHHPPNKKSPPQGPPKFRCKKCPFTTNELGDFINHRRLHQTQKEQEDARQSPSVKELDEARLKHPRKAVKKYRCTKCEFVCLQGRELLAHMERVHGAYSCPFCSQRCDTKDSFLDHLVTHPDDFKLKEWECFFMHNDNDNEEDVNNNNTDNPAPAVEGWRKNKVTVVDTGSSANTIDLTATPTTLSPPTLMTANTSQTNASDLPMPCQWCDARFANVVRLYRHVSDVHPKQKRQQEIAEGLKPSSSPPGVFQPLAPAKSSKHGAAPSLGFPKENKLLQQAKRSLSPLKVNGRYSNLNPTTLAANMNLSLIHTPTILAQLGHPNPSTPSTALALPISTAAAAATSSAAKADMGLNLSTKNPAEKQAQMFQCMDCPFRTTHLEDYLQHLPTHKANQSQLRGVLPTLPPAVSKPQEPRAEEVRCWFCADVYKSFAELYQHVQTQHVSEMLTRPDKDQELFHKVAPLLQQANRRSEVTKTSPAPVVVTPTSPGQDHSLAASSPALPSWLHQKKLLTHRGSPLQVLRMPGSSEVWYKCSVCNVMDRHPDNISKHTKQVRHSTLPKKFHCGVCGHSSNEVQAVMQHHQTSHPTQPPNITILQFEELAPRAQTLRENSTGFTPSALSPLPTLGEAGASLTKKSSVPAVQTPVIKRERMSLSPPQASSSPILTAMDCIPLDLSTEGSEDRSLNKQQKLRSASSEDEPFEDKKSKDTAAPQTTPDPSSGESADSEAQEILDAEAANDFTKTSEASKEEEEMPEFQCQHCPYSCRSSYQFRNHCSHHGLKSRYQCDYCTFSHNQLSVVSQHRTVHSSQQGFKPIYIPKINEPPSTGSDNARNSSPAVSVEPLRCADCPYRTTDRNAFNIHVSMHGGRSQYICDFCDWSADRLTILVQHRGIHADDPDFDPSPEDHVFANPEYAKVVSGEFEAKLLDSKSSEEQAQSSSPSDGQTPPFKLSITKKSYSCPQCPYVTLNRAAYDFHHSQHDGAGCFPCAQCSYRTQHWSRLCQHNRLHDEHQKEADRESAGPAPGKKSPGAAAAATGWAAQEHVRSGGATAATSPSAGGRAEPAGDQESSEKDELKSPGDCKASADAEDDDSVEMAEFPDPETEDNSNSPASDDVTVTRSDAGKETSAEGGDLQCERCPFRTTSRIVLHRHAKHHSGPGPVVCPCCDFTGPSKDSLLKHVQLHFPSTVMDLAMLQHMLDNEAPDSFSSGNNHPDPRPATASSKDCVAPSDKAPPEVAGSRDGSGERSGVSSARQVAPATTPAPTRVYACRFCDREFEDKEIMKQHERQHK